MVEKILFLSQFRQVHPSGNPFGVKVSCLSSSCARPTATNILFNVQHRLPFAVRGNLCGPCTASWNSFQKEKDLLFEILVLLSYSPLPGLPVGRVDDRAHRIIRLPTAAIHDGPQAEASEHPIHRVIHNRLVSVCEERSDQAQI